LTSFLSSDAAKHIVSKYAELRSKEDTKTLPVTPRTLETMIRLSTAHAKCRLSNTAVLRDAKVACDLMNFALYNEVSRSEVDQNSDNNDNNDDNGSSTTPNNDVQVDEVEQEIAEKESVGEKRERIEQAEKVKAPKKKKKYMSETEKERNGIANFFFFFLLYYLDRFRSKVDKVMTEKRLDQCSGKDLLEWINVENQSFKPWTKDEMWNRLTNWQEMSENDEQALDDDFGVMIDRDLDTIFKL